MSEPWGQPLSVQAWLAIPVLFAAAVLGLVAVLGIVIDADWQATLSSALCGAAAAVTALVEVRPGSWPARRRWALRVGYPAAVFGSGLWLGGVTIPTPTAIAVGLPALGMLLLLCRQARWRR
ncbi:hypothetical protein BLA60_24760 [Actinophytocola xinjiangensis]|uniref:Uncharacterized protein n=1 Tax=Actinophytocola xinjiangensis TaxID=485602 RepID=A0A7Z0WIH2_9PSEU|nr:hypothetical protein [Actinophytocola xinjiangensis]OLF08080.1 hypothetical protein BLA60_24760 [Actinophytocola xinjiangensis]